MKITRVRSVHVRPPIPTPIGVGSWVNTGREFVLLWVETDEGITGTGFTYGGYSPGQSKILCDVVDNLLAPLVIGEDPGEPNISGKRCTGSNSCSAAEAPGYGL